MSSELTHQYACAQRRQISGGYANAMALDRKLVEWVGYGASNKELSKNWLAETGEIREGRSLRSRTSRIVNKELAEFTVVDVGTPEHSCCADLAKNIKDEALAKIEPVILHQHRISKWTMVAEEIQKTQVAQPTPSQSERTLSATALKERFHKIKNPAQNYDTTLTEVERVATKDVGDLPPTFLQSWLTLLDGPPDSQGSVSGWMHEVVETCWCYEERHWSWVLRWGSTEKNGGKIYVESCQRSRTITWTLIFTVSVV